MGLFDHNATSFLFEPSSNNHIPEGLEIYETLVEISKNAPNPGGALMLGNDGDVPPRMLTKSF